jgi:DNA-binding transcriptional regulator YdaS (Cro superfamily)
MSRSKVISDQLVALIRQRAASGLRFGEQKVIAYDLGVSRSYVNQIIRGIRRKPA